jgi:hypothetical protein
MGLRASQDKVLVEIETALRGSDPRLAGMFTMFSRLHLGEEMPRLEQLRARAIRLTGRLATARRWLLAPPRSRLRTALFFPFALATMAAAVLVSAAFPPARCAAVHRLPRNAPVTRVVRCPAAQPYPLYLGR